MTAPELLNKAASIMEEPGTTKVEDFSGNLIWLPNEEPA